MSKTIKKSTWVLPILTAIIFFLLGAILMLNTGPKLIKEVYIDQEMQKCKDLEGIYTSKYSGNAHGDVYYDAKCEKPEKLLWVTKKLNGKDFTDSD